MSRTTKGAIVVPIALLAIVAAIGTTIGRGWLAMDHKVERHEALAPQVDRLERKVDALSVRVQEIAVDVARIAARGERQDRQVLAKEGQ